MLQGRRGVEGKKSKSKNPPASGTLLSISGVFNIPYHRRVCIKANRTIS